MLIWSWAQHRPLKVYPGWTVELGAVYVATTEDSTMESLIFVVALELAVAEVTPV